MNLVYCFLQSSNAPYSNFWTELLINHDYWWQNWEVFNQRFLAFRLSLFSYLDKSNVSLAQLFHGAIFSEQFDATTIVVPTISDIKLTTINFRYPTTKREQSFSTAEFVLNGDGAAFDAFSYLQTQSSKTLFALQMKFSKLETKNPLKIDDKLIHTEYEKVRDSIKNSLPGIDFVFVLIAHCHAVLNRENLPPNCIIISIAEESLFYGQSYYQRLNRLGFH